MIADAMPSKAICSAVFPTTSSMATSAPSFVHSASDPPAHRRWNTSAPPPGSF
uniref:Uncharacterized protein n=1 Tax=Arundo donax TaxID=35708 RepID=A0A0A9CMT0_ARUDO